MTNAAAAGEGRRGAARTTRVLRRLSEQDNPATPPEGLLAAGMLRGRWGLRMASPPRVAAVDAARFCLSFLVVLLHSLPASSSAPLGVTLVASACRAAVPFFLIAAGYFMPRGGLTSGLILRPLRRLLPIYVFWMALYFSLDHILGLTDWQFRISALLSGGAAYHLWYLPALGIALVLVALGRALIGPWLTGVACAVLAALSLANGAYHDLLHLPGTAARGGLLAAPMFVFIGTVLADRAVARGWRRRAAAALGAYALLVGEEWLVFRLSDAAFLASHDFMFSTFVLGAAVFTLVQAIPGTSVPGVLARLGRVSLSIYTTHLLVLWLLWSLMRSADMLGMSGIPQAVAIAAVAFVLSTGLSLLLQRIPRLRPFVA